MFWQKYVSICEEKNVKPRAIAKELDVSPATVTKWKNGSIPNRETLEKIAERLDVSAEYLMNDEEYEITLRDKRNMFKKVTSLPQRWLSLHSGVDISKQQLVEIADYVNASLYYLNSDKCVEYIPENKKYDRKNLLNVEILFEITDILDDCADSDFYRTLQIQLSRIVLSHLAEKGFTQEKLSACPQLSTAKLEFLYSGKEKNDITMNYGLNYSDLSVLHRFTGESYQYMFTGVEESYAEIAEEMFSDK